MILVLATTTWNAYNDWGGPSLYTGGTQVSFERPLARGFLDKPEPMRRKMQPEPDREALWYFEWAEPLGLSVWSGGAGWATWERDFVRWAESSGYELDVATSEDLEQHPEVLDGHRLFLSVGHDEYWSRGMRETLDAFTDAGGNAAIFSGNTCFWQVRFDEGLRSMTCFKYRADEDPVVGTPDEQLVTGPVERPAHRLARDPHDRPDVHARRLLAIRPRGARRLRRLHGLAARALGVRGHRPALRRRARAGRRDRGVRGRRGGAHAAQTACRSRRGPTARPTGSRSWPPPRRASGASTSSRAGTRTSPASSRTPRWPSSDRGGATRCIA